jgi:radical SAM superfamily enzyme YgiQ (UPF0313 family)
VSIQWIVTLNGALQEGRHPAAWLRRRPTGTIRCCSRHSRYSTWRFVRRARRTCASSPAGRGHDDPAAHTLPASSFARVPGSLPVIRRELEHARHGATPVVLKLLANPARTTLSLQARSDALGPIPACRRTVMLKVALVKPYQPAVCNGMSPPLGILYLAASLRQRLGERVVVQALDARLYSLSAAEVCRAVADAAIVGLSAENLEARVTKEIAASIKRLDPRKIVVVGGPYAHHRAREVLDACPEIDWVFDGESDLVFPEAVRRFADGESFDGILGMYYRRDGEIVGPAGVDTVRDLDALPIPAWDLVDFEAYGEAQSFNVWRKKRLYGSLFTSRGCPYKCAYCHDIFGKKFRWRSAEHVLEEIFLLVDRYGVEEFQVVDDIFNLHKPRLEKIFAGLEKRYGSGRLRFCFPNGLRGDILTEDVLRTLKRGGTYEITVAIETVTPRLQTLVQKNLDIPKVRRFVDHCYREGILVRGFFMLGFPTETLREIFATVWYALRSHLSFAAFFTVIPQPQTPLYDLAKEAAPAALEQVNQDDYYQGRSWYELATGFPLRYVTTFAVLAFYFLSPLRMLRILRSIPLWNMGHIARQFVSFLLGRDVAESLGRERLRRFRPDLERATSAAPDVVSHAHAPVMMASNRPAVAAAAVATTHHEPQPFA